MTRSGPNQTSVPKGLSIVAGSETLGDIESCACPKGDYPGLGQRAHALEALSRKHPHLLLLDGGDLVEASTVGEAAPSSLWGTKSERYLSYIAKIEKCLTEAAPAGSE